MKTIDTTSEADQALKAKHRAIWASGNYPRVAAELIPELGPVAVKAAVSPRASGSLISRRVPAMRRFPPR